jgi:gas vesicle protein
MSKRDNFAGGFLLGTLIGGTLGTVLGIVIGARSQENTKEETKKSQRDYDLSDDSSESLHGIHSTQDLEAKISQLNSAIDEVRQKLNLVNHQEDKF